MVFPFLPPPPSPPPFLLKESSDHRGRKGGCHKQKEQPRGHHPVALSTTRVHPGKQPPFPLTRGCSMGGWWHQTRVCMLCLLTVHGHPNKPNAASIPIIPAARKRVQQKSHPSERIASQRSHPTYTSLGCPLECGSKLEAGWSFQCAHVLSLTLHACTQACPHPPAALLSMLQDKQGGGHSPSASTAPSWV